MVNAFCCRVKGTVITHVFIMAVWVRAALIKSFLHYIDDKYVYHWQPDIWSRERGSELGENSQSIDLWNKLKQCLQLLALAWPVKARLHKVESVLDHLQVGWEAASCLNCLSYASQWFVVHTKIFKLLPSDLNHVTWCAELQKKLFTDTTNYWTCGIEADFALR